MAQRSQARHVAKWLGTGLCLVTLLGSWGWAFSPLSWTPRPAYFGLRWGFAVDYGYLMLYHVSIQPPPGRTERDFAEPAELAGVNRGIRFGRPWVPYSQMVGRCDTLWPAIERGIGAVKLTPLGFCLYTNRVYVPLVWVPLLILVPIGAVTAVLWYRDWRRRPRPGDCVNCGYDLTGNSSGVCPECGTAVSGGGATANEVQTSTRGRSR